MRTFCEVQYNNTKLIVKSLCDCTVTALNDDIMCILEFIPITRISGNQSSLKIEIAPRVINICNNQTLCLYKSPSDPILELTNRFDYDGCIGEIFLEYDGNLQGYSLVICKPISGTVIYHNGSQPNLKIFGIKSNLKLEIESSNVANVLVKKHKKDTYLIIS